MINGLLVVRPFFAPQLGIDPQRFFRSSPLLFYFFDVPVIHPTLTNIAWK